MPDHGRLSNNGFRNGFHRQIADNRCSFVQTNLRQVAHGQAGLLQGVLKRLHDARHIGQGSLNPGCLHNAAGQKLQGLTCINSGQAYFCGGIADIHPCNDRHNRVLIYAETIAAFVYVSSFPNKVGIDFGAVFMFHFIGNRQKFRFGRTVRAQRIVDF